MVKAQGLALLIIFSTAQKVAALEAGDVVTFGSGVSSTVLTIEHPNRDTVIFTEASLQANAAEYCERYENLTENDGAKWKTCIKENLAPAAKVIVNCRLPTIIIADGNGAGPYRPGANRDPNWYSTAKSNWQIRPNFFRIACPRSPQY